MMSTANGHTQKETWSEWVPMHWAHLEASVPDELLLALRRGREPDSLEQLNTVVNDLLDREQLRLRTACPVHGGDPACGCRYSNTIHVCWPLTQSDCAPR
jgi:hypothetical protein